MIKYATHTRLCRARNPQGGMIILVTSLFLTAGLMVAALAVQAQTAKDLYQIENKIRIEQALQLEQAAQSYTSALHAQGTQINALLSTPGAMQWACFSLNVPLQEPVETLMRLSPPNMQVVGSLPVEIEARVTAAPHSGCVSKPAAQTLMTWLGAPTTANTRLKYKSIARIGCRNLDGSARSNEEMGETCITRTRYSWVDR